MHGLFSITSFTPLSSFMKKDLKGNRIDHGFKWAFMSLFSLDDDTFTSTMHLNVDQLQKQLDKDEFQEVEFIAAFWVINRQFQKFTDSQFTLDYDSQMADKYFAEYTKIKVKQFRETLLQHMIDVKMSVAERTRHQRQYDRSGKKFKSKIQAADLKGNRIDHGFKWAFMSLFSQDDDTFTSTMLLNVDQLQKQLDKDEFQEVESIAAFWVINRQFQKFTDSQFTLDYDSQMADKYFAEYTRIKVKQFRETLLQHMTDVKMSVAERTRHQRQYDRSGKKSKSRIQAVGQEMIEILIMQILDPYMTKSQWLSDGNDKVIMWYQELRFGLEFLVVDSPNGKLIHNSILNGLHVRRMIPEPGDANRKVTVTETFHLQTDDELSDKELKQIEANDQAIHTILLGLFEDIYAAEKKAKLFNEWERFTSNEGESIESYYHHFLKLMNDLKRNKHFPEMIASNLKFLNNLQPEWSRHVTIVHQTKDLHTADYTQLYDFLKYNQKEVDELKAE
nr:hypothetical protein [Tanacetum cinerariifolium]